MKEATVNTRVSESLLKQIQSDMEVNVPEPVKDAFIERMAALREIIEKALYAAPIPEDVETGDVLLALQMAADYILADCIAVKGYEGLDMISAVAHDPLVRFTAIKSITAAAKKRTAKEMGYTLDYSADVQPADADVA